MSTLKAIEKEAFEDLLDMSGGYVLDLSNDRFASIVKGSNRKSEWREIGGIERRDSANT
jgi:hypothetical protein